MHFLTPAECVAMAKKMGVAVTWLGSHRRGTILKTPADGMDIQFDPQSLNCLQFSEQIVLSLGAFDTCFLWVTECGVFPWEDRNLVAKLRSAFGEHRWVLDAPGHSFQDSERADLTTFVHVGLLFSWDFLVIAASSSGHSSSCFISHDQWMIFESSKALGADARQSLSVFNKKTS